MGDCKCGCSEKDSQVPSEKLDTVLTILSNRYRRQVLYCVTEHDDAVVDFDVLIDYLIDSDTKRSQEDRERVKLRLHHMVLPKLQDAGILEHDTRSETVRYQGDPLIEEYLSVIAEDEGD